MNLKTTITTTKTKQTRTGTDFQNGDHMEGYQWGGGGWRMGEKMKEIRSINGRQVQNRQGEVKNSTGNGEAKELVCTTHGHELTWGNAGGRGGTEWSGRKGRQKGTTVIA